MSRLLFVNQQRTAWASAAATATAGLLLLLGCVVPCTLLQLSVVQAWTPPVSSTTPSGRGLAPSLQGLSRNPPTSLLVVARPASLVRWENGGFRVGFGNNGRSTPAAVHSTRSNTALLMAKIPTLDDWKLLRNRRVQGTVRDHPTIPNGDVITTSPLQAVDGILEERKIVATLSGSKYMLGRPRFVPVLSLSKPPAPQGNRAAAIPATSAPAPTPVSTAATPPLSVTKYKSIPELMREARLQLGVTGEVVGDDDKQYLLCGKPAKSTSGKSRIYKAYLADDDGLPSGPSVLAKLSRNWEAIEREHGNYGKITKSGVARGQFVKCIDYFPTASEVTKKFREESALILERGQMDLKRYVSTNGKLNGRELRAAAAAAAQCLQAVHTSGLVWTDMKTENFVVLSDGTVKGIDLESAMPVKDNPIDYSPEATPPEFAEAFLNGDGPYFTLEYNYDMWSFGMLLYELQTGKGYFDGKAPVTITKLLKDKPVIDLKNVDMDPKLKNLIQKCLSVDPLKRPNILQVLLHPYFLSTGIGPISF